MQFTATQALRLGNLASEAWSGLYRGVSVLGAIYNRKASPRKRGSVSWRGRGQVGRLRTLGGFAPGVSAGLKPPHSLRQCGHRIVFPGAPITRQGSGQRTRCHCLQR